MSASFEFEDVLIRVAGFFDSYRAGRFEVCGCESEGTLVLALQSPIRTVMRGSIGSLSVFDVMRVEMKIGSVDVG